VIKVLKQNGYVFYPSLGSHTRMYLPGDCNTVVHIPHWRVLSDGFIRRLERKTGIRLKGKVN